MTDTERLAALLEEVTADGTSAAISADVIATRLLARGVTFGNPEGALADVDVAQRDALERSLLEGHVCEMCFPLQQALHRANLRAAGLATALRRMVEPLEKCGAIEAARAALREGVWAT